MAGWKAVMRRARGFTLVEIMVVVLIIAALAAIAIPSYTTFLCRTRQSEARETLRAIFIVEKTYSGETGDFVDLVGLTSFGGLDTQAIRNARFYNYNVTAPTTTTFTATATSNGSSVGAPGLVDIWQLDQLRSDAVVMANACR